MLIRLRGCAGWSAHLLFAYGINRWLNLKKKDILLYIFQAYSAIRKKDFRDEKHINLTNKNLEKNVSNINILDFIQTFIFCEIAFVEIEILSTLAHKKN